MFKSNTLGLDSLKQKLVKTITFASIGVLLTLSLMIVKQGQVQGAPSTTLNFQARLLNKSGSLVADGNYHIEFKLYNQETLGTALWTETRTTGNLVTVKNGFLSVYLGGVTAFPGTIDWNEEHWLTMNIGGAGGAAAWDGEMAPRIKLTAVPYAFQAGVLAKTSGVNRGTLGFNTVANNPDIILPDASGTVCLQNAVSCGFLTGSASDYIQNGTTQQSNANFNILAGSGVAATIQGASGQNIFVLNQNGGAAALTVGSAGNVTLAADLAVNGGDITSTGALNVTPGGALVLGATTQTATLQGSTTTITSTGVGNDITLTSADQIILNPSTAGGVDLNGRIAIGNSQTTHSQYVLRLGHTFDSGSACGFFGCFGVDSRITLDNPSSPTTATGVYGQVSLVNNTSLTTAYALYAAGAGVEAGSSITDNYGLYLGAQTGGTTDYGIYSSSVDDYGIYLDYGAAFGTVTPNYGLYVKNADTYAIHVDDGATRLDGTLEIQGNTTIGDASGDTLTLNGTAVSIPNGLNFDSGTFTVDATQNTVGIGTAATSDLLTLGAVDDDQYEIFLSGDFDSQVVAEGSLYLGFDSDNDSGSHEFAIYTDATTEVFGINNGGDARVRGEITSGTSSIPGALVLNDGDGQTAGIFVESGLAANTVIAIPGEVGANDTFCLETLGNCTGATLTLQDVYDNDADGSNVVVGLNSTDGSILFRDNSTPLGGTLFAVQDSAGSTNYLSVTATGLTTSGDIAVNGGDITSTGTLNITPGGALTVGATGQTATLQGSTTTITSNGAGNDITLTSADQIILNAATGGTDINGSLAVGNSASISLVQALNLGHNYNSAACGFGCYGVVSGVTATSVTSGFITGAYFSAGTTAATFTLPTAYGAFVAATSEGSGSTITNNIGLRVDPQTVGTNNVGTVIGETSGGTNNVNLLIGTTQVGATIPTIPSGNYSIYNQSTDQNYFAGALGIGDPTPDAQFTVGSTSQFQVNSSGAVAAATGITSSGTITLSGLDCSANANGGAITASATGILSCTDDNDTTANAFLQGGNDFGANAVLGTTQTGQTLSFITANTTRLTLDTSGNATLTGRFTAQGGLTVTGNTINLNDSSDFNTNINTGTSTGSVNIGNNTGNTSIFINSGTGSINIGTGTQTKTLNIANSGGTQTIHIGSTTSTSQTNIYAGENNINLLPSGSNNTGVIVRPSTNSTNALLLQRSGASDALFRADTTNNRIYIGNSTATTGADTTLLVVDSATTTNLPTGVNGGVIYDTTDSKFKIFEGGAWKELCNKTDLACGAGASVDLQGVYDNSVTTGTIATTSTTKDIIFKSGVGFDDTTMFLIQNGAGQNLFVADTANQRVAIGPDAVPANGRLTVGTNTTAASGGIFFGTDTNLFRSAANTLRTNDALTVDSLLTGSAGATISGATINLNNNSNFNTNINTGTSTGDVTIGNDGANVDLTLNSGGTINIGTGGVARSVNIATGAAAQALTLGSTNTTSSTLIQGGTGNITLTANGGSNTGTVVNNTNNSTNAFRIQSSGSDVLFRADTTNNRVYVGNATATTGADTTLLVVDSAATANLPTGVNGGIAYDSTTNKFKIYEDGAWKVLCNTTDLGCGVAGQNQTLQDAYNNSSPATIETTSSTKDIIFKSGSGFDSTGIFQIQDSGADTLFRADTTNNRLYVGNSTGTSLSDFTLLVVDNVQDTDYLASGVNGAIVYDDEADKFKVYENGLWKTLCNTTDLGCGSAGVSQSLQDAYNNSSSPAVITTTSATKDFILRSGIGFDSASVFQIQNADQDTLLVADTVNMRLAIGDAVVAANGVLTVGNNTTAASGGIYFGTDTNLYRIAANHLRTDGSIQLGEGADRTFDVQGRTTNAIGNGLTISAGDAGAGASAFAGGALTLQGGDAAGTGNANGGDVILTGGLGVGTGAKGLVVIGTPTFSTATTQVCDGTPDPCVINQADVDGNGVVSVSVVGVVGLAVELPDPTNTTAGRVIYVTAENGASEDFTLSVNGGGVGNEIAMRQNTTATMIWNGTDWTAAGASSSTTLQAAYDNTLTSAGGAEIVLSGPGGGADGLTIRNNATTPIVGGILEVQSSVGTNLFSVNNRGTELASNGGSETEGTWTTNWTAVGGGSTSRTTTSGEFVTGLAGVEVVTTAAVDDGVMNNLSGNPVNTLDAEYQVSFTAKSSINGTPIEVAYSRDGGLNETLCTDYGASGAQNLSDAEWTKITCTITIDSAIAATDPDLIIRKTDSSSPTIWIDNLSFMRTDSTTEPSNVQIGGGIDGGPITLFTLDRSSAPPVPDGNTTYLGSMYYDTITGRIQCYEADGWGACGSAPDNFINLVPEYPGAVLNGSGVGTMTADFCSNSGTLSVNSSLCSSGQALNFYRWTSPQATQQTYSIYVTYQLPAAFKNFQDDNTVTLTARTDSTTNGAVTYEMFRSEGGSLVACGSETTVTTSANIWQTVGINGNENSSCGFSSSSANSNVIFKVNVKANSNANVYVGTLSFTTIGQ